MSVIAYSYTAAHHSGVIESGVVEAISRDAASAALTARGLFPMELTLNGPSRGSGIRLSAGDLALGLRILASLIEAGLPVARALAALDDLVPQSWHRSLPVMRNAVREGEGLSSALASSGLVIPPVLLGIIQAGEAGSGLSTAVRRAAELAESVAATRSALRSALAYPLLLTGVGLHQLHFSSG